MAELDAALTSIGATPKTPFASYPGFAEGTKRLGALGAERKTAAAGFEKEAGGLQEKIGKERDASAALAPPKLENVNADYQPKGLAGPELTDAMQTMFAFAAIGGAMTRQPMTAALNAFSGALKGLVQGDQVAFQRDKDAFDRNLRVAMAKNQQAREDYTLAFQKHRGNMQDLMNEWSILTKKHGDTVAAINAERQDVQGMLKHIESMAKMDESMRKTDQAFKLQMAQFGETQRHHMATEASARANTEVARLRASPAALKASAEKPLTEGERKTGLFYNQMSSAENQIADILEQGFSTGLTGQIGSRMANSDWLNWAAPAEAQRYAQSTEQWAEAYLRLKTGAATNKSEIVRNARTFFPQIGDKADVVDQKNRMRSQAIADVQRAAGRGAGPTATPGGGAGSAPPAGYEIIP